MSFNEFLEYVNINWIDIIIALSAFTGAILSIVNMRNQKKMMTKKLSVRIAYGFIVSDIVALKDMLLITISNPTNFSLTIKSVGFILPDKKMAVIPQPTSDKTIPCDLEPERALTIWHDLNLLKAQLKQESYSGNVKLKGYCMDALDRRHVSNPIKLSLPG